MPQEPEMPVEEMPDEAPGGYCIEIKVTADNRILVGVDPEGPEEAEPEATEGDEADEYQEVGSIGEACRLAREIYASAGKPQDVAAEQADMTAGYGKTA